MTQSQRNELFEKAMGIEVEQSQNKPQSQTSVSEQKYIENDKIRLDSLKKAINIIIIAGVYIIGIVAISAIASRALHMLLPESWSWLSTDQINKIDDYISSGIIGAIIGWYYKSSKTDSNNI